MTRLSQVKLNGTRMRSFSAVRCLFIGAGAALGLAPVAPYAAGESAQKLYPMCAFGTVIYLPFPGEPEENPAPAHNVACHGVCANERPRVKHPSGKA